MFSKTYKVAVARFPGSGSERMEAVTWLIKTIGQMKSDRHIHEVIDICIATTPITMGRNRAVIQAKQAGADYLLMIDSDMGPDTPIAGAIPFWNAAWNFMMRRREKEDKHKAAMEANAYSPYSAEDFAPATIAAPYGGPPPDECCYVFHWASMESDTPNDNFRLEMIPREFAAIKSGIQEAAALPTGLILYDMRVFDKLPAPWYRYEYTDATESHLASTEDVYQTRNASLLGLPQYCAWDSWATHIKTKHVKKPQHVTRDQVHASLVEAVRRDMGFQDRMIVFQPPSATDVTPDYPAIPEEDRI